MLEGDTGAGKTGTAQKVAPATGAYSKTKYVASFVGFAPVNSPAVTIAVILDSAQGLHQGGQVSAPVFKRIAQQVLEYMHVPHDLELKNQPKRLTLVASAQNDDDAEETSDRLGAPLIADAEESSTPAKASGNTPNAPATGVSQPKEAKVVQASAGMIAPSSSSPSAADMPPPLPPAGPTPAQAAAANGTVVLNVDSGIVVPSFMGKTLRSAVEVAQQSGLEITVLGSGIARQQSPSAGSHLLTGQKVTIRFAH